MRFRSCAALVAVARRPSPARLRRAAGWRGAGSQRPSAGHAVARQLGWRPAPVVAAAFSKTGPARRGWAREPRASPRARRHRVVRLAACHNDAGQKRRPSARNHPRSRAPPAPDTSSPPGARSLLRAPAAGWLPAEARPVPNAVIPSSRYDRSAAPVPPVSSRSVAPSPTTASLVRVRIPAD